MRQRIYWLFIGLVGIVLFESCEDKIDPDVKYAGALHEMMSGDLQARISLDSFSQKQNLYALGAIENLKGEVQIFDSEPNNSVVDNREIILDKTFDKKAVLLVYVQVPKWQNFEIPAKINSIAKLEEFIAQKANDYARVITEPFPFLIEGSPKSLDWHVIDWRDGDTVHTHQKHKETGVNGILQKKEVEIIGFYSTAHKGVFTHHSTLVHMHFKTADDKLAGHVDKLVLGRNMTLKLPVL